MLFSVLKAGTKPQEGAKSHAFLVVDNADDWNKFTTQYTLIIFDSSGASHTIGAVKVGQRGMVKARAGIDDEFEVLDEKFFSVGQDDTYYKNLKDRKKTVREAVLTALRDIAFDPKIFEAAKDEIVTKESLLRSVTGVTVQRQFQRLAKGGDWLTPYKFKYTGPKPVEDFQDHAKPVVVTFEVDPDSNPPSNIHVLIGPNGVGKTRVLEQMARALLDGEASAAENGIFELIGRSEGDGSFAGVVSVTFSAFDPFDPLPDRRGETESIRYSYVGLKSTSKNVTNKGTPKNLKLLAGDFIGSLKKCATGPKADRWREAVKMLDTDSHFKQNNVSGLIDGFGEEEGSGADWKVTIDKLADAGTDLFMGLSTGHKIVLLAITRLVETVEERTLVLFDEPESHLHPPLLSAFIRALSDLLIHRNGVAVVATHSPVVLQEVPKGCVWKLRRDGAIVHAERPESETFGENLGVLTREVFGLEITHSGFHKLLQDAVADGGTYDSILADFSKKLGAESRALLRALVANRAKGGN